MTVIKKTIRIIYSKNKNNKTDIIKSHYRFLNDDKVAYKNTAVCFVLYISSESRHLSGSSSRQSLMSSKPRLPMVYRAS